MASKPRVINLTLFTLVEHKKRLLCLTLSLQVVTLKQAYVKVVLRLYYSLPAETDAKEQEVLFI